MVVMPALMQVLFELKEAAKEQSLFIYDGYRWFSALKKTAAKLEIKFDEEALIKMDVFQTAQKFLDTPVVKALESICSGDGEEND
jgi:hypothetical protein